MSDFLERIEPMAREVIAKVMDQLRARVEPVSGEEWPAIVREIEAGEQTLVQANAWRAKDLQGAISLRVSCLVLAAYRALKGRFDDHEALLGLLRRWLVDVNFREGTAAFLLEHFSISPENPDKAWESLCDGYLARSRARYGQGWVFEQGMRDDRRFFINIRECAFADFFLAHDARDVLYLLCVNDYIWGDALEAYHIRFERPTALSEGSDACRFQFFKMKGYPET